MSRYITSPVTSLSTRQNARTFQTISFGSLKVRATTLGAPRRGFARPRSIKLRSLNTQVGAAVYQFPYER